MALFVRQDEDRSQLQQRIAAQLKQKQNLTATKNDEVSPVALEDQHKTNSVGVVVALLIVAGLIAGTVFLISK